MNSEYSKKQPPEANARAAVIFCSLVVGVGAEVCYRAVVGGGFDDYRFQVVVAVAEQELAAAAFVPFLSTSIYAL